MEYTYHLQLDGVTVGEFNSQEDAEQGARTEIRFGSNPLQLSILKLDSTSPLAQRIGG